MAENNGTCFVSSIVLWETGNEFFANDLGLSLVNAISAGFALLSNLVIAVVMKKKQLIKTPCHSLILSLTLVDCVSALVARPLYIALRLVLHEDHLTCYSLQRLARSTDAAIVFFTGCSFLHMVCIARDRFQALSRPVEYQSSREMKLAGCLACGCWVTWGTIVLLIQWFLPERAKPVLRIAIATVLLISLTVYHIKTVLVVFRFNNSIIVDAGKLNDKRLILREKKVLTDMRYTLAVFMVLFIPTAVLSVVRPAGVTGSVVFSWSLTITLLNSSVNAILHFWRNRALRKSICNAISEK